MSVERVYVGEYVGDEDEKYFPDLGRHLKPGDTVEFDEAPDNDPRFVTAAAAKKVHPKADSGVSEEQA